MKGDNISQLGDYDAPFCEQQYMHGSCYISLFKFKSFNQLIPPKLPHYNGLLTFSGLLSLKFLLYMTTSFIKENYFNNCI